jgi:hypothetical protein
MGNNSSREIPSGNKTICIQVNSPPHLERKDGK